MTHKPRIKKSKGNEKERRGKVNYIRERLAKKEERESKRRLRKR